MNTESNQVSNYGLQKNDSGFNFHEIVSAVIQHWWLFLLSIICTVALSYVYLRYADPVYNISAKILVKDAKTASDFSASQVFQDLGLLNGSNNSVDNEVELLKSRTLLEKTIEKLQLNISYYATGKVKHTAVFQERLPFELEVLQMIQDSLPISREINYSYIDKVKFKLTIGAQEITAGYYDTIPQNFGKLVFKPSLNPVTTKNSQIKILVSKIDDAVAAFKPKLSVDVTDKTVSTIDLSLKDVLPERGELMLTTLIDIYNRMNIEDKNRIADSTISFIDNRLVYVTEDLSDVEQSIQRFKQQNRIADMTEQGKLLLANSSQYFQQISQQQVQLDILKSLEDFLNAKQNSGQTIPTGLVIQDASFVMLIQAYNQLQLDRYRQLQTTTESNPVIQRLDVQIDALKQNIMGNLSTIKKGMQINLRQLESKNSTFDNQLQQVPQKEKTFLEFSRQQGIKQELYLYLLKKREETAVTKAANIANTRVVDKAKSDPLPFSPKKNLILLAALFFGMIIPSLIIYAKTVLSNKIEKKKDITTLTNTPIVGQIGRSTFEETFFVYKHGRHPLAEQLRQMKNNLDFMFPSDQKAAKTILFTSSMTGEGKSFLAINLAGLFALANKKVVVLEFDLRKPKITKSLGIDNSSGISNYLIRQNKDLQNLIKPVKGTEHLYLLSSGPIPPNPAELIGNGVTAKLFEELKQQFDYIIIDAPPIGVVTDAQMLGRYADTTLYVVRQGYTYKNQIELIHNIYTQHTFPNVGIVVNDIRKQRGFGYGYGYGSGYKYGYGYE